MANWGSMNYLSGLRGTKVAGEGCASDEMIKSYLKRATECMEGVQKMTSRKFNNEQCEYLANKLKVVVQSANIFWLAVSFSSFGKVPEEMERLVEIFKLLLALAMEIESFIQGCCKDAWIQAAMTLTNVSEYVSSVGFNLELCSVAFSTKDAASRCLTADQVDNISRVEVEIVEKKDSTDVGTLCRKVKSELKAQQNEDRDLASYLLQRLERVKLIPESTSWSRDDAGSFFGFFGLFRRVQQPVRLRNCASGATVDKAMWLGTLVAMKTFYGPEDPEFMREVEILGRLCNPNLTSMFCSAMDNRKCSIVMELMDEDLHALMQRRLDRDPNSPPFAILEAIYIMLQIGEGVKYLHGKQIVHRDLKSFNILVKNVKATELEIGYVHAKVADFGLSKIKETSTRYSNQTQNTGTNRWMAPEIISFATSGDQASTSRSEKVPKYPFKVDVYSFGMVCYEILTGDLPFSTIRNFKDIKMRVMKGDRPNLPDHCPSKLKDLIAKCWNQEPKMRPSFTIICLELKYFKYLIMTGLNPNQDPQLTTEEPWQAPFIEVSDREMLWQEGLPWQAPLYTVPEVKPWQGLTKVKNRRNASAAVSGKLDAEEFTPVTTIPDGTKFKPGTRFTKKWRLRNIGYRAWPKQTGFVHVKGETLGSLSGTLKLFGDGTPPDGPLGINGIADVSLDLVAPNDPGLYTGYWRLFVRPTRERFGPYFKVQIEVLPSNDEKMKKVTEEDSRMEVIRQSMPGLLSTLDAIGFKQGDLNQELLKKNEYDLERTIEDLIMAT